MDCLNILFLILSISGIIAVIGFGLFAIRTLCLGFDPFDTLNNILFLVIIIAIMVVFIVMFLLPTVINNCNNKYKVDKNNDMNNIAIMSTVVN